jgi:hypothetical protein
MNPLIDIDSDIERKGQIMSEQNDIKCHKIKPGKRKTSLPRKSDTSGKERQHTEPTANELMFRAWQKIYENRHSRLF